MEQGAGCSAAGGTLASLDWSGDALSTVSHGATRASHARNDIMTFMEVFNAACACMHGSETNRSTREIFTFWHRPEDSCMSRSWDEAGHLELQAAWMKELDPTAPSFWQRVARHVPGKLTADQCHDKYMSLYGATPAAKPSKPRGRRPRKSETTAAPAEGTLTTPHMSRITLS